MATVPDDLLQMSDDDFGNLSGQPAEAGTEAPKADGTESGAEVAPENVPAVSEAEAEPKKLEPTEGTDTEDGGDDGTAAAAAAESDPAVVAPNPADGTEAKPVVDPVGSKTGVADAAPALSQTLASLPVEEKAALFNQIMKPFKANGKTIELRSADEAIQLMQMGANYTKKLQELHPHRKVLMMLENNGLLDEGKLSFLIDVERKNPEAIKKLLKDSNIDPMDIDVASDSAYVSGNHTVPDAEVNFRTVLDELNSKPNSKETLQAINTEWDKASKQALWQAPEIMTVIHDQREAGIYDVIVTEVARRKTLGTIPATTPFLEAYKAVGDEMAEQAIKANGGQTTPKPGATAGQPLVLDTRVVAPKSSVTNGDKAAAASPTRSSPKTAEVKINPLEMADEDFLKQMNNRL